MRRLRTIDELYEQVKDYDLVITNDVSLETALNSRISTPRIGPLAMTPRHIASHIAFSELRRPTVKDIRLISEIHGETGFDLRYIFSEIQNFREIRRHTAEVEKHLVTRNSKRVYELYSDLQTVESVMSSFDPEESGFFEGKTTAVIGVELFDDLDKHFIPLDADFVDMFDDGEYEIETIHEVGNDRQLADNAVDLIDPERADDYAIVLNSSSPLVDAVRTSLYRRGLPFINRMEVRDMAPIRDYLGFLTYAFNYDTVRIGQVRELLASFNGFLAQGTDGYLLSRLDEPALRPRAVELKDIMRRVCHEGMTFGEVRDLISYSSTRLHVTNLLKDLDLENTTITPRELSNLRYAVENLSDLTNSEERHEDETSGVLIADCSRSVYVDRPIVLYLGMEQDWNVPAVGRRYIDPETESEKNALRFSALIQQGERRIYIVNTTKRGDDARPCLFFDQILKRKCERFSDIAPLVRGRWLSDETPAGRKRGEMIIDGVETFKRKFSKTSFDAYYSCPRRYMFNALLPSEEKKVIEFGTLIHSFAELYACHGDEVRRMGIDSFVNMISDRYSGLSSPTMEEFDSDAVRQAMRNIMRYIDLRGVRATPDASNSRKKHPNRFIELLGLETSSTSCETDHQSTAHEIHGEFDLLWDGVITDYKTGKGLEGKNIGASMTPDSGAKYYEFQPLLYLALASETVPGFSGRFDLFYVMDHDVESSDPDFDIRRNIRTVSVVDGGTNGCIVGSRALLDDLREELKKDMREHAEAIIDAVAGTASGDPSGWRNDPAVVNAVVENTGLTGNNAEKDASVAIGKLASHIMNGMVVTTGSVEVPSEVLDAFLEMVDAMHSQAVEKSLTDFEAMPKVDCRKCDYFEACTRDVIEVEGGEDDE